MDIQINDKRGLKSKPLGFVVFHDRFMSGWGKAKDAQSFFCLAYNTDTERETLLENGQRRDEMTFHGVYETLKDLEKSLEPGDHLSIRDRKTAGPWYEIGAFKS